MNNIISFRFFFYFSA
nr:hypothetical protein [Morganella morganii]